MVGKNEILKWVKTDQMPIHVNSIIVYLKAIDIIK